MYKLPERRGGGVIWAMPERKHSFLHEVFPKHDPQTPKHNPTKLKHYAIAKTPKHDPKKLKHDPKKLKHDPKN